MKKHWIVIMGIITALSLTFLGAELALAKSGGSNGGNSCKGGGQNLTMSQKRNTYQYQYQNQYQYRQHNENNVLQSKKEQVQGDQNQLRSRTQLRDPSKHLLEPSE